MTFINSFMQHAAEIVIDLIKPADSSKVRGVTKNKSLRAWRVNRLELSKS